MGRVREWLRVLADNDKSPGLRGWATMAVLTVRLAFRRVDRSKIRSDYRKCRQCPIHDRQFKRCGANDGLGCSCYTVYAIVTGKPCWGKETIDNFPYGY